MAVPEANAEKCEKRCEDCDANDANDAKTKEKSQKSMNFEKSNINRCLQSTVEQKLSSHGRIITLEIT